MIKRASDGKMVMVVYPTERVRNQFVQERINKSVLYTPYYKKLEHIIKDDGKKKKGTFSISLKNFGDGTIAFVGSESKNAIVSFAADDIIIDELPLCNELSVAMTPERQSDSRDRTTVRVGNPLITDADIHKDYNETDKKIWSIRCSSCGKIIFPNFLTHVFRQENENVWTIMDTDFEWDSENDISPICDQCHKPFDRYAPGEWVAEIPSRSKIKSGYAISKIFCTADTIRQIAETFNKGLDNDDIMQRVYNADFGMPYVAKGSKLDSELLNGCVDANYSMPQYISSGTAVMGIDVGRVYNVVIRKPQQGKLVALFIGIVDNPGGRDKFKALFELIRRFRVSYAVIDGMPELGLAKDFCMDFKGGFRWFRQSEKTDNVRLKEKIINANRTRMLDDVRELFLNGTIINPRNAASIPDYYNQLTNPARVFNEVQEKYEWVNFNRQDHYFFSEAYCNLAYKLYRNA
jgi:hypothetical protein